MSFRTVSPLVVALLSAGILVACSNLKDASDGTGDGGATGDGGGADGSSSGGDGSTPGTPGTGDGSVGSGNGDPRWPQGPVPPDDPPLTSFKIANGTDGALILDLNTGVTWQDAVPPDQRTLLGAQTYCSGLTYDGKTGWRLPTRWEILSVMSFMDAFDGTSMTTSAFSSVSGASITQCFWSSSTWVQSTGYGWEVSVSAVGSQASTQTCAARCVLGPAIPAKPTVPAYDLSDPTAVRDPVTGLTWEKTPPTANSTRADAATRCAALTLGGKAGRLPTVKELSSIVDETKNDPAASGAFGNYTEEMYTSNSYWKVMFYSGTTVQASSDGQSIARCVAGP